MVSTTPLANVAEYQDWLGYPLPAAGPAGQARHAALSELCRQTLTPPEVVAYHSQGRLLVIGPEPAAMEVAASLHDRLVCTVLLTWQAPPGGAATASHPPPRIEVVKAPVAEVAGYLGAFTITVQDGAEAKELGRWLGMAPRAFDLVLDLRREPAFAQDLPPPGYFAPRGDARLLARAMDELPDLLGEFQKPRYFAYDPAICAHGNSGLTGCTRCLDVCPTLAIRSLGERIEVDPYLCQGAGSCSAVCPTGAISYTVPVPGEQREQLRQLLKRFRAAAPDTAPALLFHDGEAGRMQAARIAAAVPEWLIPWPVEEIGSTGVDVWLTALAHGARGVVLLATASTPPGVRKALDGQLATARAALAALGYGAQRVQVLASPDDDTLVSAVAALPEAEWQPAQFSAGDEKRTTLRLALEHLYAQAQDPAPMAELESGAPFGDVQVDGTACTLCMACAGLCPTAALLSGDGEPALRFIEWNCIQCGLCRTACPEDAIELAPRLLLDPERRMRIRVLHEDAPFNCVVCGKPFATQSVMTRMAEKLSGHWMFQTGEAKRRVQMCADCRVRDLLEKESGADLAKPRPGQRH